MWNRVILCHNDKAGKSEHKKAEVLEALRLAGLQAEYCSTGSDSFPHVLDTGADLIIAAGGDGTVGKVAKHIGGRDVKLGILPIGTANNIARSFGIYGAPHEVAEGWRNGHAFPCRLATVGAATKDMMLIESAGIGPFSDAIKDKAGGKNLGAKKLRVARESLYSRFAAAEAFEARIVVDGKDYSDEPILGVEIMNISYAGPGIAILPVTSREEDTLKLVVLRPRDRTRILSWLSNPLGFCPPVEPVNGEEIKIFWRGALLHVDDAVVEPTGEGEGGLQMVSIRRSRETVNLLAPGYYRPRAKTGEAG